MVVSTSQISSLHELLCIHLQWSKLHYLPLCVNFCVYICSGLNFTDLMVRQGAIDNPPKVPFVMGFECAGEVEAVGEAVDDLKVSRHVLQ